MTPFVLVSLVIFLAALALTLTHHSLWQARTEMQNAADAATLAAVGALADECLPACNPARMQEVIRKARNQAIVFAGSNPVQGQALILRPNLENYADGDIVFGFLDNPRSPVFVAANLENGADPNLCFVNAVRIVARRTRARGNPAPVLLGGLLARGDVVAAATAMLDRGVIGFRPGSQPFSLAPIGLASDPTGQNPLSWEYQVRDQGGVDNFRFDRQAKVFHSAQADGLFEMEVQLALPTGPVAGANGCLLSLGTTGVVGIASQLKNGVSSSQLQDWGGQFVLGQNGQLTVTGTPRGPKPGTNPFAKLHKALNHLRQLADVRIWPLVNQCDPKTKSAVVSGFVAARVVRVGPNQDGVPLGFTLQPTLIATSNAVTVADLGGGPAVYNPYIVKLRRVQ